MAMPNHPEFHKALMEPATYDVAKRRIKYVESRLAHMYKTGDYLYSVRKEGHGEANPAIKEVYSRETLRIGKRWAPEVYLEVLPLVRVDGGYALGGPGVAVDYALKCVQLSDAYWLDRLVPEGKVNPAAIGKLARYLAEKHQEPSAVSIPPEVGRPEHLLTLAEEIFYQVKKYFDVTGAQPVLDAVTRPLTKFAVEHRKLFLRRQKKGCIVECHGSFVASHIYLKGKDIFAVSPLAGAPKFRLLDAVNDVATLLNDLARLGAEELGETFLKRYVTASKDREAPLMLPAYRTLQAMRSGLALTEALTAEGVTPAQRDTWSRRAQEYFQVAVLAARDIPR